MVLAQRVPFFLVLIFFRFQKALDQFQGPFFAGVLAPELPLIFSGFLYFFFFRYSVSHL